MKSSAIFLLLAMAVISCNKKPGDPVVQSAFEYERSSFFNSLRNPSIAAEQLRLIVPAFNPVGMSDPTDYPKYMMDEVKAAANMGIYLSDLNYSIAYRQPELTSKYFTAAHELSKAIGVDQIMLNFLLKRYNDNLTNNDSVRQVVLDFLSLSTSGLQGTERERLVGISMCAYQIEDLHLALGVLKLSPQDSTILVPLSRLVINQRPGIETIYRFLKASSEALDPERNPNFLYYAKAFQELISYYMTLESDLKTSGSPGSLDAEQIKQLSDRVDAIRDKAVSVE